MNGKKYSYTEWVTYTQGNSDGRFEAFLVDTETEERVAEQYIGNGRIRISCYDGPSINLSDSNFSITGSYRLYDNSYGQLYWDLNRIAFVSSSSKRYKEGITGELDEELDPHKLYNLQVKQFKYKHGAPLQYDDMKNKTIIGFIAEEVNEVYPSAVIHNHDGTVESWDERRIIPPMLKLIQEQKQKIDELEERITKLENIISKLI